MPQKKLKSKQKRYFGLRLHPGWAIKRGTKMVTLAVEITGIPKAYSSTVAWFAERMILVGVIIAACSFSGGILFNLYLSEPIAESPAYNAIVSSAETAKDQIIDLTTPLFAALVKDNHEKDSQAQLAAANNLRKEEIKNYLQSKDSPLAQDDAALNALVSAKNMKLILAISFVESNFGKHCYYYNCSGIGGTPPNLRKYVSYAAWVSDFDKLLEDRYKGLPPEKFIGLYVQPGSPNWIYGVNEVLNDFNKLGIS